MYCAVENYKKLKGDDAGALYLNGRVETKPVAVEGDQKSVFGL